MFNSLHPTSRKGPARSHKPTAPVSPAGPLDGSGASLDPSPNQMGAQTRKFDKSQKGFADQGLNMATLARLAPTNMQSHLMGPALQGLSRAAGGR